MRFSSWKQPSVPSITYSERTGVVCDATCRSDALREASVVRAALHGQRF